MDLNIGQPRTAGEIADDYCDVLDELKSLADIKKGFDARKTALEIEAKEWMRVQGADRLKSDRISMRVDETLRFKVDDTEAFAEWALSNGYGSSVLNKTMVGQKAMKSLMEQQVALPSCIEIKTDRRVGYSRS